MIKKKNALFYRALGRSIRGWKRLFAYECVCVPANATILKTFHPPHFLPQRQAAHIFCLFRNVQGKRNRAHAERPWALISLPVSTVDFYIGFFACMAISPFLTFPPFHERK